MICEHNGVMQTAPPKHDVTSPTLPQSPIIQETPPDPITHHFAETRHAAAGDNPWPQIPDSCTRAQKTATHKSSMSTGNPHRSLSPNPTLPVHACKEDCKVKKSDAKHRADNAPAMNNKLGVSAGRCPVTLMQHEATPSHGMGPATMGSRHRTLQLVDGDV
jgi:hypothetical protein